MISQQPQAVSATGTGFDTEAADTGDTSKKSADSQKDDAAVAGKKEKSDNKNSNKSDNGVIELPIIPID